jgi:hypothetical protein
MTDADDGGLGHANLIAYSRALAGWGRRGGCHEDGRLLLYATGSWLPVGGNGAFRRRDDVPAADLIAEADTFFGARARGYSIKVRDSGQDADLQVACEAQGLVAFSEPVPQMVCRHHLGEPTPPPGVELRRVVDEGGVADFVAVNTEAYATYGMPADVLADMFDQPERVLADEDTIIVVAYLGQRPVATALTYLHEGVGGLQWVGTASDVRHLKLGWVVTQWATNVAFERGATACTLQASPMGAPLYLKLGYETVYHYREYVRWKAPAAEG